jgi:ketosteroid isomerase-like protein
MGEDRNRATIEKLRNLLADGDVAALAQGYSDLASSDFVEEWPQSGERIRGLENFTKINARYSGETGTSPRFTQRRVLGSGDLYVVEGTIDYGDGTPVSYVGIVELRDGKIAKMTEYFANPFEAPAWRADFVERMDKVRV